MACHYCDVTCPEATSYEGGVVRSACQGLALNCSKDRVSGMGPAHTDGGYFRPHGRGRGPRRTPHRQPDLDVSRESMLFRRALRYRRQERSSGFPRLLAGRSSKTVPEAASVRSDWPCRNGSGLMEFERSRCRARAARLSSSRPTFAASPIPLDARLRLIYASHATPACAVHLHWAAR